MDSKLLVNTEYSTGGPRLLIGILLIVTFLVGGPGSAQDGKSEPDEPVDAVNSADWQVWKQGVQKAVEQRIRNEIQLRREAEKVLKRGVTKRSLPKEPTLITFIVIGNSRAVSDISVKPANGPLYFCVWLLSGSQLLSFPSQASSRYAEITGNFSIQNDSPHFRIEKIILIGDPGDFPPELKGDTKDDSLRRK